jgi:hypothetical protein
LVSLNNFIGVYIYTYVMQGHVLSRTGWLRRDSAARYWYLPDVRSGHCSIYREWT